MKLLRKAPIPSPIRFFSDFVFVFEFFVIDFAVNFMD